MNFDLADEQKMLAEQARAMLGEESSYDRLRELIDGEQEWDEPLWRSFAELGFFGARIPQKYGGLGLGDLDLSVISEELGRSVAAIPFHSSVVCAALAIETFGSEDQKEMWLPELASGKAVGVFAHAEGRQGWWPDVSGVVFADGKLSGLKTPVADAGVAHLAIILCRYRDKPCLAMVDLSNTGIRRRKLDAFDHLRGYYALEFDSVPASLLEASVGDEDALRAYVDRLSVQMSFEAVGGAEACVFMARDYAMDRQIFGRSLASYQVIKHKLADALVGVEFARSNAFFAAWASTDSQNELSVAAASAQLCARQAYEFAARENLQVHGGIGYTFEANCHFHYRRERTLAITLGSRQYWADRLIDNIPRKQMGAS